MGNWGGLVAQASTQYGLFTNDQAAAHGLGRMALCRAARAKQCERVLPGVYRLPTAPSAPGTPSSWAFRQRLLAACLWAGPDAVVSHAGAARLYGLDGFDADVVEVSVPRRMRRPSNVTRIAMARVTGTDRRLVNGIPVTSVARTLLDIAADLTVAKFAQPLDAAWRRMLIRLDYLEHRLKSRALRGRAGLETARRALRDCHLRGRPLGSILEVRTWYLLRAAELPLPCCGLVFEPLEGQPGSIDLAYPEHSLAIECDGYGVHALTRDQFEATERRASQLTALGWRVQRITKGMLDREPGKVVDRVWRAIATPRVVWRPPPGVESWRQSGRSGIAESSWRNSRAPKGSGKERRTGGGGNGRKTSMEAGRFR